MNVDLILNNGRERRDLGGTPSIAPESSKLVGYAARFYDPNDPKTEYRYKAYRKDGTVVEIRERILPGAFDLALKEDETRGMYNHRSLLGNRIPGRDKNTLELRADSTGLWYEVDLADTTTGRDVKISLERGDITGSSFVFTAREGGITARQENDYIVRELRSLFLHDVSAVDYPAYAGTTAELRSKHAPADLVELLEQASVPETRSADPVDLSELSAFQSLLQRPEGRGSDVLSTEDIRWQLTQLIRARIGAYTYAAELYDTFFIYDAGEPPKTFKHSYAVNGGEVSLVGSPMPVFRQTVYPERAA
jgi:hypothetical protein